PHGMAGPDAPHLPTLPEVVGEGRFRRGPQIGEGNFGVVFSGTDLGTGGKVAIKFEKRGVRHPQLLHEAHVLTILGGAPGFARVHWTGLTDDSVVTDLLGPSLDELLAARQGKKFSVKTVAMIAEQLVVRMQHIHSKNFLHRDIKPENFLMGCGDQEHIVHVIDLGFARPYLDSKTKEHIPRREGKKLTGTARYVSINTHLGILQSRRDDLESLGYMLLHLRKGLPWEGIRKPGEVEQEKYEKIMDMKI
ncbi:unnamed protein product, partial [Prorocentrum cordatum]